MKRWVIALIVVVLLALLIGWRVVRLTAQRAALAHQRAATTSAPATVSAVTARVRNLENTYSVVGTVTAPTSVNITPKVTGRILYLIVHEGDIVRPGQVLVRLDPSEIDALVQQQRAAVIEAQRRLTQAQYLQLPTNVGVQTAVQNDRSEVVNAQVALTQAQQGYIAQVSAAQAAVTDAQARLTAATAAIATAQAGIASAQASLASAQATYTRTYTLYREGYESAQDVDTTRAAYNVQRAALATAQSQLNTATANRASAAAQLVSAQQQLNLATINGKAAIQTTHQRLTEARATLQSALANLRQTPAYVENLAALRATVENNRALLANLIAQRTDTILTAPMSGVVASRLQDPGSLASPSQVILNLQSLNDVWVAFAVPDDVGRQVQIGQAVDIVFDVFPKRHYRATITQFNPVANTNSRLYTVRVTVRNGRQMFRPGMFATVTVATARQPNVVSVPREAVHQNPNGTSYVVVVNADNTVEFRPVTAGLQTPNYIAILQGLSPGERVVTLSAYPLRPGQKVRVGASINTQTAGAPAAGNPGMGTPGQSTPATGVPTMGTPGQSAPATGAYGAGQSGR